MMMTMCLLAMVFGQNSRMQAQQAVYVYCKDKCYAIDIHANPMTTFAEDTLDMGIGIVYQTTGIDSITYSDQTGRAIRLGWWGELDDGTLNCYYESTVNDAPDMSFKVTGGLCTNAWFLMTDGELSRYYLPTHRVGGKWRYVRNTLSGHKKVRIRAIEKAYENGTGIRALKGLLDNQLVTNVQRAVNIWYRPELTSQLPSSPIFGNYTDPFHYRVPLLLAEDSIYCTVSLAGSEDRGVSSDTIHFIFPTEQMAMEEFEQMDLHNDDSTFCQVHDRVIEIVENFPRIPFDEMKRRLTFFDLNMCRPIFIREDEE